MYNNIKRVGLPMVVLLLAFGAAWWAPTEKAGYDQAGPARDMQTAKSVTPVSTPVNSPVVGNAAGAPSVEPSHGKAPDADGPVEVAHAEPLPDHILRSREISVNSADLPTQDTVAGSEMPLILFGEVPFTVLWTSLDVHASNNFAWHGVLKEDRMSIVTLTRYEDHSIIHVRSPDFGDFELEGQDGKPGVLREFNSELINRGCPGGIHVEGFGGETVNDSSPSPAIAFVEGGSTIDVLMVYTQKSREKYGSHSAAISKAQSSVNSLNSTFGRSSINHRVRLVQAREVSRVASGSLGTELGWVAGNSTVAGYRTSAGADLVAFISDRDDSKVYGMAQMPGSSSGNSSAAYSANYYSTVSGVWPHEAGHNFGCNHNSAGVYSYSSGHYWKDGATTRGTIMSYIGTRISYFSNPNVSYSGHNTGTSSRDNARSITNMGDNLAGYRSSKTVVDPNCSITTGNKTPYEGSDFTITVTTKNNGPGTVTSQVMAITLTTSITIVSHDGGGAFNSSTKVWNVPTLGIGATAKLTLTVKANAGSGGTTLTPTATIRSISDSRVDLNIYNNDSSVSLVPKAVASPPVNVIAHYPFDSGYNDMSGNGRHGTLTDVGTLGNTGITTSAGNWKFGSGALNVSTDRDFIAIPSKTFAAGGGYTIAFWAKKSASNRIWDMAIGQRDNGNYFLGLNDALSTSGRTGFRWRGNGTTADRSADFMVASDTLWHHYAVVVSGTTVKLYADGVLKGTATGKAVDFIVDTIGEARAAADGFQYNGLIDEVWIVGDALEAGAISTLYTTNTITSVPSLGGFYHRYDGDFFDSGDASNDGIPVGAASITESPWQVASGSGSLLLDGAAGSHVNLRTAVNRTATEPWSAIWWARRGEIGASKGMVMGKASDVNNYIWLDDATGLKFKSSTGVELAFTTPKDMLLRHYALVANGTGMLSLYVNGVLSSTLTGNTAFFVDTIGKGQPTTSVNYNFSGSLDEVQVVTIARTATQINQSYLDDKAGGPVIPVTTVEFPFDKNFNDSGPSQNHGMPLGTANITSDPVQIITGDGALSLDGSSVSGVSLTSSIVYGSNAPWTVTWWARRGELGASKGMVIGKASDLNNFVWLNDASGLRFKSSSGVELSFNTPKDQKLHHYALVADGTGKLLLHLDGELSATLTGDSSFVIDSIGTGYPTTAVNYNFQGNLDQVHIISAALNPGEVMEIYETENPGNPPDPVSRLHYRYDGDFLDSGGSENHGAAQGTAGITVDPVNIANGSGALSLDGGVGCQVTLATPETFAAGDPWTVTWWARRGEIGANKGMVMGSAADLKNFIWLNDISGLRFRSSTSADLNFTTPRDQQFHHYALAADGEGKLALYLDGQLSTTLTGDTSFVIDTIGNAYPTTSVNYNFKGSLDEVQIIRTKLEASQVNKIYMIEKYGVDPDTVSRLRVVLVGGQSNADGRAITSDLPTSPVNLQAPQRDVDIIYKAGNSAATHTTVRPGLSETAESGPELSLGRSLGNIYQNEPGTRVVIIKYAKGGTDLMTQWKAGGTATTEGDGQSYATFQQTVTSGLANLAAAYPSAAIEIESMVWMQGESDAVVGSSGSYGQNLAAFIADIRATYKPKLPFVLGRLSVKQTALDQAQFALVRAAQESVAAADPYTALLNTDSFGIKSDNLHFSGGGQQSLGTGFAEKSMYLIWMTQSFPAGIVDSGLANPEADNDGDGQPNHAEFLAGTDPNSAASVFQATIRMTAPSGVEISYPTSPARVYRVDRFVEANGSWEIALPAMRGNEESHARTMDAVQPRGIFRAVSGLP